MAELLYRSSLKLWLRGDGARASTWNDSSGVQAVGAFAASGAPAIAYPVTGVPPYVSFGGASDFYTGPAESTFATTAGGTLFVAFNATAAVGTAVSAINDDVIFGGNGTTNPCLAVGTVAGVPTLLFDIVHNGGATRLTLSTPITLGVWNVCWFGWSTAALRSYLGLDPIIYTTSSALTASVAVLTGSSFVGKSGAGAPKFFNGQVGEILSFNTVLTDDQKATVFNYLSARWENRGDQLEMMRDIGSRAMWERGLGRMHMVLKGIPISTPLPATLLDDTRESFVSHPLGIDPLGAGNGWGEVNSWEPRPGRVEQITYDFDSLTAELRMADLRPFRHSLVDSGIALAPGVRREGPMVSSPGAVRVYSCDTVTQYVSAVDGISVVQALPDEEKATPYGLSLHSTGNALTRSSFISGLTGLTPAGTGVNGSAIALDTADCIFDTNVQPTPQSLKFAAGSPHTTDLKETWPASSVMNVGQPIYLAVVHAGNGSPAIQVQRSSDSKWLQDTSGNWGVSAVWVSLPTPGSPYPSRFSIVSLGIGATATYTLTVGLPSGGTAGRAHHVYHVEMRPNECSPANGIINATDTAAVVSSDSLYQVLLNSLSIGGPIDAQTLAFMWRPAFTGFPSGAGTSLAWFGTTPVVGATTGWELRLDGSANLVWRAQVAGPTYYSASIPVSPVLATTYRVVIRRISSHGDLGMTPYALSVFLNGTKGTDAVEGSHPSDANVLYLPTSYSAIANLTAWPYALSDSECAAWGL